MSYELEFLHSALKEWQKLGHTVREQIKKKLREHLDNPKVQADALRDMPGHYKIKLRAPGYRLVYRAKMSAWWSWWLPLASASEGPLTNLPRVVNVRRLVQFRMCPKPLQAESLRVAAHEDRAYGHPITTEEAFHDHSEFTE